MKKRNQIENFFNLPVSKKDEEEEKKPPQEEHAAAEYDEKDEEVETLYSTIHDIAISTHDRMLDDLEDIEPKYSARFYEVAANYLDIALKAAEKRGKLKEHKDKLTVKSKKETNITNNRVVINTTDLIKKLSVDVIDGEIISDTDSAKKQDKIDE